MSDMTLLNLERTVIAGENEAVAFVMDEEAFRIFYERTSRSVWAYLFRMTGDGQLADDLLQEAYYRFLRARKEYESESHRQNALYRIATNVARDAYRRGRRAPEAVPIGEEVDRADRREHADVAERAGTRTDVGRALARLRPRDRELLWLAYAQEFSHQEIAEGLGLKTSSIKLLLWRARQRFMELIRKPEGLRLPGRGR